MTVFYKATFIKRCCSTLCNIITLLFFTNIEIQAQFSFYESYFQRCLVILYLGECSSDVLL